MQEELVLNKEQHIETEDYEVLQEAVKKLSQASESQFEDIKKEKWFNRVFDMVTFSQKGKKRVAEQVGTLAQAQQIFSELLVRLSANDEKLSQLILLTTNDIEKLQEQNMYLFTKIKQIEKRALGICSEMNINQLTTTEKIVLRTILEELSGSIDNPSDLQKDFAFHVFCNLTGSEYFSKTEEAYLTLESCEEKSRKSILTCCLEYLFLKDGNEQIFERYQDFIERFDLGNKTIDSVIQKLIQRRNSVGIERFSERYKIENVEDVEDCFFIEFEDNEEESDNQQDFVEMQDEEITNILHIHAGETKEFYNKNIHIRAFINCEGNLCFENCVLYYNERPTSDEIVLAKGAKISIVNSVVICNGYDKSHFIKCEGENDVRFSHSTFIDCCYLLEGRCNFSMTFCKLENCCEGFVHISGNEEQGCEISKNVILIEKLAGFYDRAERAYSKEIIHVGEYGYGRIAMEKNHPVSFSNNVVIDKMEKREKNSWWDEGIRVFHGEFAQVVNCTFEGLSSRIVASTIKNCKFEKCQGAIATQRLYPKTQKNKIEDCVFIDSANVIEAVEKTQILNCQFISCEDVIIKAGDFDGGVKIEFCDFVNIQNTCEENRYRPEEYASIQLYRSDDYDSTSNLIKRCKFDGVDIKGGFLIASTNCYSKPAGTVAYIENCDFRNSITKRKSGCIIKQYVSYYTLFKKEKSFQAIQIRDCRGLDKINRESGVTEEIREKETNAQGEHIGTMILTDTVVGAVLPTSY